RHGTYCARRKVPEKLQNAVAQVLGNGKTKQTWLKRSLGTKVLQVANVRAKPVQMEFDRIFARAEDLLKARPLRTSLSKTEIKRMADYTFAQALAVHDEFIRDAPAEEAEFRKITKQEDGFQQWVEPVPTYGLSGGQMLDARENLPPILTAAEGALARGDIQHVTHKIED